MERKKSFRMLYVLCSIFLLIGSVVVLPLGIKELSLANAFESRGKTAKGFLTAIHHSSKGGDSVDYTYMVGDNGYRGSAPPDPDYYPEVGQPETVIYLPDDPQTSTTNVGGVRSAGRLLVYVGGYLVIFSIGFPIIVYFRNRRRPITEMEF